MLQLPKECVALESFVRERLGKEMQIVPDDEVGVISCAELWVTKGADKRLIEFFSRMPPHYAAHMALALHVESEPEANRFVNLMIEARPH